jgi:hypothetical protein
VGRPEIPTQAGGVLTFVAERFTRGRLGRAAGWVQPGRREWAELPEVDARGARVQDGDERPAEGHGVVAVWVQPAEWSTLGGKRRLDEPEAWCCLSGSAGLHEAAVAEPRLLLRDSIGRVGLGNSGGRVRWPPCECHPPRSQLQVQSQRKAGARPASRNGTEVDSRKRVARAADRHVGLRVVPTISLPLRQF